MHVLVRVLQRKEAIGCACVYTEKIVRAHTHTHTHTYSVYIYSKYIVYIYSIYIYTHIVKNWLS